MCAYTKRVLHDVILISNCCVSASKSHRLRVRAHLGEELDLKRSTGERERAGGGITGLSFNEHRDVCFIPPDAAVIQTVIVRVNMRKLFFDFSRLIWFGS